MRILSLLFIGAAVCFAQNWEPDITNARFENRAVSGNLESQLRASSPTWFGYAVPAARGDHESCCWNNSSRCGCSLEGEKARSINVTPSDRPVPLEGSNAIAVLFRVENNAVQKIQLYSLSCPLDAGGMPFVWLTGISVKASLSYLEKLVTGSASNHLQDAAILAISQHDDPEALNYLIQTAKNAASPHVRSQTIFWLAQKAGKRAASTITDAIENDPNTEVKKSAVFALSQLPEGDGVPKLIAVAKSQKNAEIRKQAFFWLGQSKDPRALAFIEEVLTRQ